MEFIQLDLLVLEQIIPNYLNLKDKVNYFRALYWSTPERFFIKHVKKSEKRLNKMRLFYELYFIKYNFKNMSNECIQFLKYQHWLYISARMPMNRDFILQHRDKLIIPALVNNKHCFKVINLWTVDRRNSDTSFKVFNCWMCNKRFTTYRSRRIKTQYYTHYCYVYYFQYIINIKEFYLVYDLLHRYKRLLKHYAV